MKNLNKKTKDYVACLIPSSDFSKFQLLSNIAFEEGAGFVEIRIPCGEEKIDIKQFEKINGDIILALEPKNFQKEVNIQRLKTRLEDMLIIKPFAIELHENLGEKQIQEILTKAKIKDIKVIISSYSDSFSNIQELKTKCIELSKYNANIIKLTVEIKDEFEAIEILKIHREIKDLNIIINPSGEKAKIIQLLAPFYGSIFTYGYISQKIPEAQISLGYLLKSLEYFQQII
ncbi:MAG TPA: type I 3-dehydroquinate dehydratase [candidate division Zixibacteria bacterium]|nr:type I 3-dehydroquinate dehydratase [candidate division Zixibacteria bacterium]